MFSSSKYYNEPVMSFTRVIALRSLFAALCLWGASGLRAESGPYPALLGLQTELDALTAQATRRAPPAEASAPTVFSRQAQKVLDPKELDQMLARSGIVHVGEVHDNPHHHRAQAEVLSRMAELDPNTVLGLEMLDATHQEELDRYMEGAMGEEEFAGLWKKEWKLDFELYRPVFHAARKRGLKAVALNAPRKLVRKAAFQGLDALSPEERALLAGEIHDVQDPRYYAMLKKAFENSGHGGTDPEELKRYVFAMQIWNETMAANVLKQRRLGRKVAVIAGAGHLLYSGGIAEGIRLRSPLEIQNVALPLPMDGENKTAEEWVKELRNPRSETGAWADLFWLLPAEHSGPGQRPEQAQGKTGIMNDIMSDIIKYWENLD